MKKSIKKNYILNLIYQITLVIVPLIVTPYVSRILLPDGVGKYSFSFSLITYFTLFATFGFETYAQREIAKYQDDKVNQTKAFWEINICRLIPVFLSLAVHLALFLTNVYGEYSTLMLILSINIVAVALDVAFFFQGNEEFGKLVTRNVLLKILGTILIFVFVKEKSDLGIYTLINSLIILFSNVSLWPALKKKLTKVSFKELKPLSHLKGSFSLLIPALAISLYAVLDKTLIGVITGSDSQNGYYEQAEKIVKLSLTLITCLSTVMIPRNSYEISQGNHEQVKINFYKGCNFIWILGLPMVLGIILVADNLVPWFLGKDFTNSTLLLKVFAPLVLIIGFSNVLGRQYMIPYKKENQYTLSIVVGSITNIILNLILIYHLNAVGAAIATIVAELGVTITMYLFLRKELSLKEIFKTALKPLLASLIMFITVYPITLHLSSSILNSILIIGLGCIVYGLAILILREKMTINILSKIKNKFIKK